MKLSHLALLIIAIGAIILFDRAMRLDLDQLCRTSSAPVSGCP